MKTTPTKRMRDLCNELGKEYSIKVIDGETVIYRDFHNGYDVEISGVDTTDPHNRATIYLWKDRTHTVKIISDVAWSNIGDRVEELRYLIESARAE